MAPHPAACVHSRLIPSQSRTIGPGRIDHSWTERLGENRTFVQIRIARLKLWVGKARRKSHMPRNALTEGGCTGDGPVHGREAGAGAGARARDVMHDVARLVAPTAEVASS